MSVNNEKTEKKFNKEKYPQLKKYLIIQIFAFLLALTGLGLAWYWFSWKLVVVLLIVLWANNIDNRFK